MSVDYWYLLPVGFAIAALAMSSGISAGNFWVPVYLLWARFEPSLAFWLTLATMLCGYGSGVVRNLQQGTLEPRIVIQCLTVVLPTALVGGYLAPSINVSWLILLFGMFVLGLGAWMLVQAMRGAGSRTPSRPSRGRGQWMKARLSANLQDRGICLLGGLLLGLITVGLGELLLPRLLAGRRSLSPAAIVGSAVVVIFVSSLAAALVRLNGPLLATLGEQRAAIAGVLLFAAPGAILGGQLGPMAVRRLNVRALRWYVAIILLAVGILMLVRLPGPVAVAR